MKKFYYTVLICTAIILAMVYLWNTSKNEDIHIEIADETVEYEQDRGELKKPTREWSMPEKYQDITNEDINQRVEELKKDGLIIKLDNTTRILAERSFEPTDNPEFFISSLTREESRTFRALNSIGQMINIATSFPPPSMTS